MFQICIECTKQIIALIGAKLLPLDLFNTAHRKLYYQTSLAHRLGILNAAWRSAQILVEAAPTAPRFQHANIQSTRLVDQVFIGKYTENIILSSFALFGT